MNRSLITMKRRCNSVWLGSSIVARAELVAASIHHLTARTVPAPEGNRSNSIALPWRDAHRLLPVFSSPFVAGGAGPRLDIGFERSITGQVSLGLEAAANARGLDMTGFQRLAARACAEAHGKAMRSAAAYLKRQCIRLRCTVPTASCVASSSVAPTQKKTPPLISEGAPLRVKDPRTPLAGLTALFEPITTTGLQRVLQLELFTPRTAPSAGDDLRWWYAAADKPVTITWHDFDDPKAAQLGLTAWLSGYLGQQAFSELPDRGTIWDIGLILSLEALAGAYKARIVGDPRNVLIDAARLLLRHRRNSLMLRRGPEDYVTVKELLTQDIVVRRVLQRHPILLGNCRKVLEAEEGQNLHIYA